ncbi:fructose bisphosphate aldolase [Jannaschia aquimarina]|uniref:fructose-bisphosphate aldolase n=1 Tax=Jannaschia aquimarina TaxID=935700 RepID=A0A0D1EJZ3_9RHOB|nr:fructose bisphosphate aldolase [Jannaschia aquimarina]KIT17306.1 Fructose-bisphosphate aldolase class 1 [Jannaschia aquimarina]SNT19995.1 fructose-bisphosphate aldolase [Jannaschia aquimarina]
MPNEQQAAKIEAGQGFIAALDQSGGSTPKALRLYGVEENEYSGEDEMFDKIHEMRSRIVGSPAFNGDRVVGAILFEQTMDRDFHGRPAAEYLWEEKGVVPFLKIDHGLADEEGGMQLMKEIAGLDATLERAKAKGIFGTKERSVIGKADAEGIRKVAAQQFDVGRQVLKHDLVPILEPEVTISIADKAEAEALLKDALLEGLNAVPDGQRVMFKLTLPEEPNLYAELVDHPKVLSVVALSGGYSREEANARLARNRGMIASFSRALTEGLSAQQSEAEFDATLDTTIQSIRDASVAG